MECTGDHFPSPAARPTSATAIRVATLAGTADPLRSFRARSRFAIPSFARNPLTEHPAETAVEKSASGRASVNVEDLHQLVLQSLDDDQAVEVVSIPLAGKSNIADHMVIASGRSTRQVASMAVKLGDKIKERFGRNVKIEGLPAADWVLIDADDVIVHIFRPEVEIFTIWNECGRLAMIWA